MTWQQGLAIALVFALLMGTLMLLRRKGIARFSMSLPRGSNKARQMQLIERLQLSPHHSLHLVKVKNKILLVGVSPSGCDRVASFADSGSLPKFKELI